MWGGGAAFDSVACTACSDIHRVQRIRARTDQKPAFCSSSVEVVIGPRECVRVCLFFTDNHGGRGCVVVVILFIGHLVC